MKKIIFILLISLITIGCNKYVMKTIYEQKYYTEESAEIDIYHQVNLHNFQVIPLKLWISNEMITDTIKIEQKMLNEMINNKSSYQFIYTKFIYPSNSQYKFLIRFSGRKKDLVQ